MHSSEGDLYYQPLLLSIWYCWLILRDCFVLILTILAELSNELYLTKAMLVVGSRLEILKYKKEFDLQVPNIALEREKQVLDRGLTLSIRFEWNWFVIS